MKKKIISLCLVMVLAATAVLGGTLAYFTDTDKATNTFTVGNVKIDLHEANNDGKVDEEYHKWLNDQVLMPGDNQTNTIAKHVYVENTGVSKAYVRVHIAIPSVLDNANPKFDASYNLLHFNADPSTFVDGEWNWGQKKTENRRNFIGNGDTWNFYEATIGKIEYNVYVVTYETAIAKGEKTVDAMHQVYLDKNTTNENIENVNKTIGGEWNILVFAEGGQIDGFDNAFDALNTQFGNPTEQNYIAPWNR